MSTSETELTAQSFASALGVGDKVSTESAKPEHRPETTHGAPAKESTEVATTAEAESPAVADKEQPKTEEVPKPKTFTQEQLDAIIAERLARERKARKEQEEKIHKLEAIAAKPLDQFIEEYRTKAAEEMQDNEGITLEEAKRRVEQSTELAELRRKQAELEARQKENELQSAYNAAKQRYSSHALSSLVREVESEVDVLSNNGAIGTFDDALYYTIGKQMVTGDLYTRLTEKIRRDIVAAQGRRPSVNVESPATAASEPLTELLPQQKQFADFLGVPHKEYAKNASPRTPRR